MFKRILVVAVAATLMFGGVASAAESPEVEQLFRNYEQQRKEKKYTEAATTLDLILELDPNNAHAMAEGAWVLNELGKHAAAAEWAGKAIKVNPNHSGAWVERGYAFLKDKKYNEATVALLTAIQKNPKSWAAYDYLAETMEKMGEFKTAQTVRDAKAREKAKVQQIDRQID